MAHTRIPPASTPCSSKSLSPLQRLLKDGTDHAFCFNDLMVDERVQVDGVPLPTHGKDGRPLNPDERFRHLIQRLNESGPRFTEDTTAIRVFYEAFEKFLAGSPQATLTSALTDERCKPIGEPKRTVNLITRENGFIIHTKLRYQYVELGEGGVIGSDAQPALDINLQHVVEFGSGGSAIDGLLSQLRNDNKEIHAIKIFLTSVDAIAASDELRDILVCRGGSILDGIIEFFARLFDIPCYEVCSPGKAEVGGGNEFASSSGGSNENISIADRDSKNRPSEPVRNGQHVRVRHSRREAVIDKNVVLDSSKEKSNSFKMVNLMSGANMRESKGELAKERRELRMAHVRTRLWHEEDYDSLRNVDSAMRIVPRFVTPQEANVEDENYLKRKQDLSRETSNYNNFMGERKSVRAGTTFLSLKEEVILEFRIRESYAAAKSLEPSAHDNTKTPVRLEVDGGFRSKTTASEAAKLNFSLGHNPVALNVLIMRTLDSSINYAKIAPLKMDFDDQGNATPALIDKIAKSTARLYDVGTILALLEMMNEISSRYVGDEHLNAGELEQEKHEFKLACEYVEGIYRALTGREIGVGHFSPLRKDDRINTRNFENIAACYGFVI